MRRDVWKLLALLLPVLTGCLSRTHKLQQPKLAGPVQNADVVQLVEAINRRYAQVNSLTAPVDFSASVGGAHKGKQTDYTSIHGYILYRKPQMLRVLGLVPVLHTHAFDLASDGSTFVLVIPPKSQAIEGSTTSTGHAANPLENLRPDIFLDSLVIRNISADEIVSLTNSSETTLDPKSKSKQLIETPQYDLAILSTASAGTSTGPVRIAKPQRVIHFSRADLMPTELDVYDSSGDVETKVTYGPYQSYGGIPFPTTITINRPLDEFRLVLTIEKVTLNPTLPDEQFHAEVPKSYKVQKLP